MTQVHKILALVVAALVAAAVLTAGLALHLLPVGAGSHNPPERRAAACADFAAAQTAPRASATHVMLAWTMIQDLVVQVDADPTAPPQCLGISDAVPARLHLHVGDQVVLDATEIVAYNRRGDIQFGEAVDGVVSIARHQGSDQVTITAVRAGTAELGFSDCHGTAC